MLKQTKQTIKIATSPQLLTFSTFSRADKYGKNTPTALECSGQLDLTYVNRTYCIIVY